MSRIRNTAGKGDEKGAKYLAMSAAERIMPSLLSSERLTMRLTPKLFIILLPSLPSASACPKIRLDYAGEDLKRYCDEKFKG
jgi:hypothetical protein